jgi:hypothetical protein
MRVDPCRTGAIAKRGCCRWASRWPSSFTLHRPVERCCGESRLASGRRQRQRRRLSRGWAYREFESLPLRFAGFRMVAGDLVNSEPELAVPARPQEDAQNRVSATRTGARLARKRRSRLRGLPHGRAGRLSPCCMSAPFKYHLQQVADELVGRGSDGGRTRSGHRIEIRGSQGSASSRGRACGDYYRSCHDREGAAPARSTCLERARCRDRPAGCPARAYWWRRGRAGRHFHGPRRGVWGHHAEALQGGACGWTRAVVGRGEVWWAEHPEWGPVKSSGSTPSRRLCR